MPLQQSASLACHPAWGTKPLLSPLQASLILLAFLLTVTFVPQQSFAQG